MKISQMLDRPGPIFSFEFFPPKTEEAADQLLRTVGELGAMHQPDYVSVTYGAGGSTRERTLGLVARIQKELRVATMAHLTCVGHTKDELRQIVARLAHSGIENVLALRGDPPQGTDSFVATEGGFGYASDLAAFLREEAVVDVGGACYPEVHPESKTASDDLHWTAHKVRSGAQFLVTQLFFDNADYFRYVARARSAGIDCPIVPGIMPITNVAQIERFTKMCGSRIPTGLKARLEAVREDPGAVMATGTEHAIVQCRELLEKGAPGVHFYTLNKSHATRAILAALR